jgi:internalin A
VPSYATNKNVTWSTDNPAIVRITLNDEGKADGTIFAAAAGTAKITVTTEDGSKTALCTVTVEP